MAHHGQSSVNDEFLNKMVKEFNLGETKEFPQGKLNKEDEGELRLAVGVTDSKVVINFGKPVAWIGFDKEQALGLAKTIIERAYQI